jgi:hypothetical protein
MLINMEFTRLRWYGTEIVLARGFFDGVDFQKPEAHKQRSFRIGLWGQRGGIKSGAGNLHVQHHRVSHPDTVGNLPFSSYHHSQGTNNR